MSYQPVLLGIPLSLGLRGLNTVNSIAGGTAAAAAGALAVTGGALATYTAVAPWLETTIESGSSKELPIFGVQDAVSLALQVFTGALAFMDMNANMVRTKRRRRLGISSIPSMTGDWIQDLGSHSPRFSISGSFYDTDPRYMTLSGIMQQILKAFIGNAAVGSIHLLNLIMDSGVQIPFVTKHEITFAMISDFDYKEIGGDPLEVKYDMELIEVGGISLQSKTVLLQGRNLAYEYLR